MREPLVIRKNRNRRLYDVASGKYTSFAELLELIKQGIDFRVEDLATGKDVTSNVLLQIIVAQESQAIQGALTNSVLRHLISICGSADSAAASRDYFDQLSCLLAELASRETPPANEMRDLRQREQITGDVQ